MEKISRLSVMHFLRLLGVALLVGDRPTTAFVLVPSSKHVATSSQAGPQQRTKMSLFSTSSPTVDDETVKEIASMRASDICRELRDLGVSYEDISKKEDLAARLAESRAKAPKKQKKTPPPKTEAKEESPRKGGLPSYEEAKAEGDKMRVKALTAKLKDLDVSTYGMFEKDQLVDAYAKALSTGKKPGSTPKTSQPPPSSSYQRPPPPVDEDDDGTPVKELKTRKMKDDDPQPQAQSPFGGGGSPFGGGGGGGSPFGDMGGIDLGSIFGDMMGGQGSARGSPFGGSAGNPFGGGAGNPFGGAGGRGAPGGMNMQDLMQKAMSNPGLMAKLQKATQNPRMMAAMQDVMKNGPGAMNKYANDPEIRDLLNEMQKIM